MANVIRSEKTKDREWWLEKRGDDIVLKCSGFGEHGWEVFRITGDGFCERFIDIGKDEYEPQLQLDDAGRIKLKD